MICTGHQILFGGSNKEELDGRGMQHECGRGDFDMAFWPENLREGGNFENTAVDGLIILKWIFKNRIEY